MKLVSENDPHRIAVAHARSEFEHELRIFVANQLRIIAGAGEPYGLFQQMHATLEAWAALIRLDQTAATQVEFDTLVNALISKDRRWHADQEAERDLMREALRYVAADMLGQASQRSSAGKKMYTAIRDIVATWER